MIFTDKQLYTNIEVLQYSNPTKEPGCELLNLSDSFESVRTTAHNTQMIFTDKQLYTNTAVPEHSNPTKEPDHEIDAIDVGTYIADAVCRDLPFVVPDNMPPAIVGHKDTQQQ